MRNENGNGRRRSLRKEERGLMIVGDSATGRLCGIYGYHAIRAPEGFLRFEIRSAGVRFVPDSPITRDELKARALTELREVDEKVAARATVLMIWCCDGSHESDPKPREARR